MGRFKGRNIRVDIAKTYGGAVAITEVSASNPAVATKVAHGLNNDMCGYFRNVSGMARLDGQAVRIKNKTNDTFELQGLNTTTWGDFTTGEFVPVTAWETLAEATDYDIGGGAAEKLDGTTLLDDQKVEEQGLLPAATASCNVLAQDTPSLAGQIIEAAVDAQDYVLVRITLANGAVRLFRGEPSLPGESVQKGQLATGSLDFSVKGRVLKLAA